MVKILQGSVVTETMLGGLTTYYVPKIMKIGWQHTKLLEK